jgi:hypothetical protein
MIVKAHKLIREYHSGAEYANNVVKVVYFHGNDLEPLNNWKDRLPRTLDDVSDFYSEELSRHGVETDGIPFEKTDGEYVFHMVKGDSASRYYSIKSGPVIIKEIFSKTKGKIDFSKDYVLVISGLCYRRDDGTYVFHSPYFGTGSSTNGICMVADCELLDSKLLNDNTRMMKFSEMTVKLKECAIAEFNSWYIGGIAHEIGHIFGLPHDFGNPVDLDNSTISLMGQYGSRHFRNYLWGGEKSAVFSSVSVLHLISHPVFTQSDRSMNKKPATNLLNLRFDHNDSGIILKAQVNASELPYAVIALLHPSVVSEYYNKSFSSLCSGTDSISVSLGHCQKGIYSLQLRFIYPYGASEKFNRVITVDGDESAVILNLVK